MVRYILLDIKNDDSLIYVGSTIQPLFKRWFEHKKINDEKAKNIMNYYIKNSRN